MKLASKLCIAATLALGSSMVQAGPYTDDLSRCLVSSTTEADKTLLMKWIFSAIALNQEVAGYVNIPAQDREKINKDTAALYMRLLTDSCKTQVRDGYKYEGQASIGAAFQVLGQIASQGIFTDPKVVAGMEGLTKYFDEKKLGAVFEGK